MTWSTREIAQLAGTSLRAVRHYHEFGLLDEPARARNGYKKYGVAHLVRILRIKRLSELGFSLSQIKEMGDEDDHPHDALRTLDTELAATIDRLQRTRVELALILDNAVPTDLPAHLAPVAAATAMTEADRSYMVVLTRVLGPKGLQAYTDLLRDIPSDPAVTEFDALAEDAAESVRQDLAERMVPYVRGLYAAHPGLENAGADAPGGGQFASETVGKAIADLYNAAQIDVLRRLHVLNRSD